MAMAAPLPRGRRGLALALALAACSLQLLASAAACGVPYPQPAEWTHAWPYEVPPARPPACMHWHPRASRGGLPPPPLLLSCVSPRPPASNSPAALHVAHRGSASCARVAGRCRRLAEH